MSQQRQIVLDTETTGLSTADDHRIIEIGCVELVNRRITGAHFHQYLNPERDIDAGALEVHGITNASLADKPRFADIVDDFLDFIEGAELIIHNAAFDIGFLNHELGKIPSSRVQQIEAICTVVDTLKLARDKHPGQKNNLDALCRRYHIDNTNRTLHGALLDAEILAEVYLAMTGGQVSLSLNIQDTAQHRQTQEGNQTVQRRGALRIIRATEAECQAHEQVLQTLDKQSQGQCIWLKMQ